ncbi:uncharacterized protein K02A2.6-like [Teleopsis dalmanni]|uniref:uncharacterized protein K02A2.6-like n=1 Tax=Teleopsis dalmanni TaxID=139649 RepID=UPI0018CD7279|nr:uncharacterized protein K02A2.6-like [Teleopsis dalmanni]
MSLFKKEVDRLTNAGIWKPVKFSQWASPIVLAPKADGSIRICGDFKQAVNAQIDIEQYPLPIRESLFHKINCGQHFTKIDLKDAYLQMELDDEAKTIMVVNTPLGLFQYQRLPFGIASAPAIFQRYLEQLLQGVEGCGNYLDDIIISAPTFQQHISHLEQVLRILQQNGILPDESGLKAVKNPQPPKDLKQAEALMGKVNYYHNFIPNFSQLSAPINMLRRKNVKFTWGTAQQQAFIALKTHILNAAQLAHYQEDLPLVLATDASSAKEEDNQKSSEQKKNNEPNHSTTFTDEKYEPGVLLYSWKNVFGFVKMQLDFDVLLPVPRELYVDYKFPVSV